MVTDNNTNNLVGSITMAVVILMAIGVVFVFSASSNISYQLDLRHFYNFPGLRQILFFPLAIAVMLTVSHLNYHRFSLEKGFLKSPVFYLLILSTALLIIVLIPSLGTEVNRARRWLKIPIGQAAISFQPSELAKWAIVFFVVAFCDKFNNSLHLYWKRFAVLCSIVALTVGLIIIEDFGTAAFIVFLSFIIFAIAGVKFWHLLTPLPIVIAVFIAAVLRSPSRISRILAFLDPEKLADSAAYQPTQSLIALGSGGIFGKGLGRGICKYGHLPEDTTDFIFAIIGEELGFVGNALVIGLFIIFIWLSILVIIRCKDQFGQLLATGIVLAISIQAAVNIGVVTVVLPTKGIALPFVSAGGSSLILSAAAVGVLLNIAKQSVDITELKDELPATVKYEV